MIEIFSLDGEEMTPGTEEGGETGEETPSDEPAARLGDGDEEDGSEKGEEEKA